MIHGRSDYYRFNVDPATNSPALLGEGSTAIGADEPVMLFRAKDILFLPVLRAYAQMLRDVRASCEETGSEGPRLAIIHGVEEQIHLAEIWQEKHHARIPTMPEPGD